MRDERAKESRRARPKLEIESAARADVFWSGPRPGPDQMPLLRYLDRAGVRVIGDVNGMDFDPARQRRIAGDCSGLVTLLSGDEGRVLPLDSSDPALPHLVLTAPGLDTSTSWEDDIATVGIDECPALRMPKSSLRGPTALCAESGELAVTTRAAIDAFVTEVTDCAAPPPYAFLIGRLEADFAHAREAIRAAVEREAGLPCLWSDDGRHRLDTDSVRGTTRQLIEGAALVIADLTLGPENPTNENPSRAHEIGLSMAFERRVMLCSREPRRYPYFSIGDMQMYFWSDEQDLHDRATEWLRVERGSVGRTVLNHRLAEWDPASQPTIRPADFHFDPARRYLWPLTRQFSELELLAMAASIGGIVLSLAIAAGLHDRIGPALYAAGGLVSVAALVALSRWTVPLRAALGRSAALLPAALVGGALALTTLVLLGSG